MKKFLLSLAAVALAGSAFAENKTITFSELGYANGAEVTTVEDEPITLTFAAGSNSNSPKYYNTGTAVRLYAGNTLDVAVSDGYTLTTVSFTTQSSYGFINTVSVTSGSFANGTWTAPEGETISSFKLTNGGASGHTRIVSMTINYESTGDPTEPIDPTMSFDYSETHAFIGSEFEAPKLTCNSDGAVTYSSSNASVATVDSTTGVITLVAKGSTTITATVAATEKFNEGTASYVLNVNLPLPGITYGEQKDYVAFLEKDFTAPELLNPNNVEVIYESTDESVATIDAEGKVSIIGLGSTVISATYNESDEYSYQYAFYNLTVKDPNAAFEPTTFIFEGTNANVVSLANKTIEASNLQTLEAANNLDGVTLTSNEIMVSFAKGTGTNAPRYWSAAKGTEARIYKGNNLTVSAKSGYQIEEIVFTKGVGGKFNLALADNQPGNWDSTNMNWIPKTTDKAVSTVVFSPTDRTDIASIKVVYKPIITGVESVEFDSNAPKEYYNMQGVRVENPGKGLYIVRQGSKAFKVIL